MIDKENKEMELINEINNRIDDLTDTITKDLKDVVKDMIVEGASLYECTCVACDYMVSAVDAYMKGYIEGQDKFRKELREGRKSKFTIIRSDYNDKQK